MKASNKLNNNKLDLKEKANKIKLVLTDIDGVLTDTGVYYSEQGEMFKRFSIRDGMGVVRLRELTSIDTGIITGELSGSVKKRAEKLKITELHQGVESKELVFKEILKKHNIKAENVAFIGDDVNDLELLKLVGLSASPADGFSQVTQIVDYVCQNKGGNGAFREFAELIINLNNSK